LPCEDRFVLIAEQHVTLAARERLQRFARALVEYGDALEQLRHVVPGLLGRLALLELRAVGGHDVPLRAAGGERVRLEHVDALLDHVVPGPDVLRIPLPDHEDHDRLGHEAVVLVLIPVLVDEPGLDQPRHVRL
jgi:hypothetical protein